MSGVVRTEAIWQYPTWCPAYSGVSGAGVADKEWLDALRFPYHRFSSPSRRPITEACPIGRGSAIIAIGDAGADALLIAVIHRPA